MNVYSGCTAVGTVWQAYCGPDHKCVSPCCQVVEADIFSAESLKPHFKGQDAVMSCLGFPASFLYGVTGYTLSMRAAVSAMREVRVNRIITMTSWYTDRKSDEEFCLSVCLSDLITVYGNQQTDMV